MGLLVFTVGYYSIATVFIPDTEWNKNILFFYVISITIFVEVSAIIVFFYSAYFFETFYKFDIAKNDSPF